MAYEGKNFATNWPWRPIEEEDLVDGTSLVMVDLQHWSKELSGFSPGFYGTQIILDDQCVQPTARGEYVFYHVIYPLDFQCSVPLKDFVNPEGPDTIFLIRSDVPSPAWHEVGTWYVFRYFFHPRLAGCVRQNPCDGTCQVFRDLEVTFKLAKIKDAIMKFTTQPGQNPELALKKAALFAELALDKR